MALTPQLLSRMRAGPLGLGGAPLGNLYAPVPEDDAIVLVDAALAAGIGYFDTAPHYGNGLSERRLGAALRSVTRERYVLSTKVGRLLVASPDAPARQHGYVDVAPYVQHYDYSAAGILRSLAESRARLGIDRVDIVYVHDLDRATHGDAFARHFATLVESGLPALAALKAAGVIAAYGIGVNGVDICVETLRTADLDVILLAGRYTLADTSALPELLPLCERRGVSVVLGGPFNSGILATGTRPPDGAWPRFDYAPAGDALLAHVAAIEAVCAAHDVPLAAAALQFAAAHPAIAVVVAGARSPAELATNLAAVRRPIPGALWRDLRARGLIDSHAPVPAAVH